MAEKSEYYIKVEGVLVDVSKDVYLAYYSIERHIRTLVEKDVRNGKVLYSALDTEETLGEEMIPDLGAASVEDVAIANVLSVRLHQCLELLPMSERELLHALYFEGLTERQLSKRTSIPQRTINDRRNRALAKLKKMFNV